MSSDTKFWGFIISVVVSIAVLLGVMIAIIVTVPDSAKVTGDFFIKPGEQVIRCTPDRSFVDFSSPNISVYESPYGTPDLSTELKRSFNFTEGGHVRLGYFESFKHYFTAGSVVQITGSAGSSTADLKVLRGYQNYLSYVNDNYYSTVFSAYGKDINGTLDVLVTDDYYFIVNWRKI